MSMIEMAYELKDVAKFMVASQGDVPDLSFPYDSLVGLFNREHTKALDPFKGNHKETSEFLQESVRRYALAYQDYICTPGTSMKKTTLSCVRLENLALTDQAKPEEVNQDITAAVEAVKELAQALFDSRSERGLPDVLISARKAAIGFAGGLFVDLVTFSDQLLRALKATAKVSGKNFEKLQTACEKIQKTIPVDYPSSCVVANAAEDARCHGISIYFPYLTAADALEMQQPLAKTPDGGDTGGIKGLTGALNQIATTARFGVRQWLIEDTEDYYPQLKFAQATGWYKFIRNQWSRILAENEANLDFRYSAQQCAENLQ